MNSLLYYINIFSNRPIRILTSFSVLRLGCYSAIEYYIEFNHSCTLVFVLRRYKRSRALDAPLEVRYAVTALSDKTFKILLSCLIVQ